MDDELCEPFSCKLRSVRWLLGALNGFGANDGAHLSKGCTRGMVGLRCVLPLLRVLRFTTIASALNLSLSTLSATCTPRCDPYTTVLVQQ